MGLELGTPPYQKIKNLHSLCCAIHLLWEYLPPVWGSWMLFCLWLKSLCHMGLGQPHCYNPALCNEGTGFFHGHIRRVFVAHPNCHGDPMHTAEADFALPVIYASKTLFHSLLDCVVVALVTAITKKPWAKVFRVLPWDWLTAAHYSAWQNRTL